MQNQRNIRRIMRLDLLTELLEEEAAEMRLIAQMKALSEAESLYAVDLTEAKRITLESFTKQIRRQFNF